MTSSGPAVIVAVHDGYYGSGTGAGRSNRSFLTILCSLLALRTRLVVMPVLLTPGSPEYDPAWHKESAALVGQAGGEVIPVDNGTAGQSRFGDLGNFRQASASAAAAITRVLNQADQAVAVAFDARSTDSPRCSRPGTPHGSSTSHGPPPRCTPPPTTSDTPGNAPGCWPPHDQAGTSPPPQPTSASTSPTPTASCPQPSSA